MLGVTEGMTTGILPGRNEKQLGLLRPVSQGLAAAESWAEAGRYQRCRREADSLGNKLQGGIPLCWATLLPHLPCEEGGSRMGGEQRH